MKPKSISVWTISTLLSRRVPCLCKVAPNTQKYHIQDVNRSGGILGILGELSKGGLLDTSVRRVDGTTLAEAIARYDICGQTVDPEALRIYSSAPGGKFCITLGAQQQRYETAGYRPRRRDVSGICLMLTAATADWLY